MQAWIMAFMDAYGYLSVALLIALENIFPPIPSEVILCFGGFMTTRSTMVPWLVIVYATIGSIFGAMLLYGVGRLLPAERLEKILDGKIGKILRLKSENIEKAQIWFDRKGKLTVFFCRFIPIIRSLISIPAGMAKMKIPSFLFLTTIGSAIWNCVLVYLGKFAGASWETIVSYIDMYANAVLIGILFLIVMFFIVRIFRKKKKSIIKPRM